MCQTLFAGKGITSHMAPKVAVKNIKNLTVSSTENGCQNHSSMLDAYKRFDKYLDEENIVRPVVVLSDGPSSRFDFAVLKFFYVRSQFTHSLCHQTQQLSHSCWIKVQIQNFIKNTVKRGRNSLHHSKLLTAKGL